MDIFNKAAQFGPTKRHHFFFIWISQLSSILDGTLNYNWFMFQLFVILKLLSLFYENMTFFIIELFYNDWLGSWILLIVTFHHQLLYWRLFSLITKYNGTVKTEKKMRFYKILGIQSFLSLIAFHPSIVTLMTLFTHD